MYRYREYILSLNPQKILHELDYIFSYFLNTGRQASGSSVVCLRSSVNGRLRMIWGTGCRQSPSIILPTNIQVSPKWESRSRNQLSFRIPVSVSVSDQCGSSLRVETVPNLCFMLYVQSLAAYEIEPSTMLVEPSWVSLPHRELVLLESRNHFLLIFISWHMFVDPDRMEFSRRQNTPWLGRWTFYQMDLG